MIKPDEGMTRVVQHLQPAALRWIGSSILIDRSQDLGAQYETIYCNDAIL